MTRLKRPSRQRKILYVKDLQLFLFGIILAILFCYVLRQIFLSTGAEYFVICAIKKDIGKIESNERKTSISNVSLKGRRKYFLLIGVMTAERYIERRAQTILDTWGSTSLDLVKLLLFSGETRNASHFIDIVHLPVHDDSYPPQKKSFMMLNYIFQNYIDDFHWFLRADDDVYIRIEKLTQILLQFDSSQDVLLGQAGEGKFNEKGKLGLNDGDNFCIGGVGVIMSQNVVKKVSPHLVTCMNETASLHEDSELGRCIRKYAGVMCPWAQELQHVFYQNFQRPEKIFSDSLNKSPFKNAISIHPVKQRSYMLHLHHHFLSKEILELQHRAAILNHRMFKVRKILGSGSTNNTKFPTSHFDGLLRRNCSLHWEFFDSKYLYGVSEPPFSWISGPLLQGMRNIKHGVMSCINNDAHRLRKSQEELKKINSGTIRVHPTLGLQLRIDVETLLRPLATGEKLYPGRTQHYLHFEQRFGPLLKRIIPEASPDSSSENALQFIVPLAGRFETFKRFLESFEKSFLNHALSVGLVIVYFPDVSSPQRHKMVFEKFQSRHAGTDLTWIELDGEFSRARALETGVLRYVNNSLIFFADVDLIFNKEFYYRCKAGSIPGRKVYFPIMFSQFSPQVVYNNPSPPVARATVTLSSTFSRREGVWRKYSFGPVCVYSNDVIAAGGFNTSIRGWGLEDIDFYEKCLQHKFEVARAPDVGLVHVYHSQTSCVDPRMNDEQSRMCEESRRQNIASEGSLVDHMLQKGYL